MTFELVLDLTPPSRTVSRPNFELEPSFRSFFVEITSVLSIFPPLKDEKGLKPGGIPKLKLVIAFWTCAGPLSAFKGANTWLENSLLCGAKCPIQLTC